MYAEISAALTSAKAAIDIGKAGYSLSNFNTLVAAISEINAKLMTATTVALASQEKQSALADEVRSLKEELMRLKSFQVDSERYQLQEIGIMSFVYVTKKSMLNNEPIHYLCAACFQNSTKSILQLFEMKSWGDIIYKCHRCESQILEKAKRKT